MSVSIKINGIPVSAEDNCSILEAAMDAGIRIPSLCHIKGMHEGAVCRVCLVEDSSGKLFTACDTPVREGMDIRTDTETVLAARRKNLELMCENHRMDCDNCVRYTDCEFHNLCSDAGINSDDYELFQIKAQADASKCIIRDNSKCVMCRRCIAACSAQGLSLISAFNRGPLTQIGTALPLSESGCIGCGQCAAVCPTSALIPTDETEKLWKKLLRKEKPLVLIVTTAAASMIGEAYHDGIEKSEAGKTVAIFRKIGFDRVYSADYFKGTYMTALAEEARDGELLISSSCPGIKKYIESHAPDLLPHLSKAKTALVMLVEAIKSEMGNCDIVFLGSCTAAKAYADEIGLQAVLTVTEGAAVIDRACVSRTSALRVWRSSKSVDFDLPLYPAATMPEEIACTEVKGLEQFIKMVRKSSDACGIIVASACPGGCVNGGGQYRLDSAKLSKGEYMRRQ